MKSTEDIMRDAMKNNNASGIQRNQFNVTQYESSFESSFGSNFTSQYGFNQDLDTSQGLYKIAKDSGLQKKANEIMINNSGEEMGKIFSGGFISDIFDVLNTSQYGVTGVLKGEGFAEGVKSRSSFSDKDSLGQYGLGGVMAGTILDIAVDPLTYIAPWTVLKKVPGVMLVGKKISEKVIGKRVTKLGIGAEKSFETFEGGIAEGKALSAIQKVAYMFGADPAFKDLHDRMLRGVASGVGKSMEMVKGLSELDVKSIDKVFGRDEAGRFFRTSMDELQSTLNTEDLEKITPIWNRIDEMGKEMVDLGMLSKDKYEENLGSYIKNVYEEYELANKKGVFGTKTFGIRGGKTRKEGLDEATMKELGQIDDPQYVLGSTMVNMVQDIESAKFAKSMREFASDVPQEGFERVADTRRFAVSAGSTADAYKNIGILNKSIKPLLSELKGTFKADGKVLSELKGIESELETLSKLRGEALSKYISDVGEGSVTKMAKAKNRIIPEELSPISNQVKRFDTYEEMVNSKTGIQLEKLHINGVLESYNYGGEKGMEAFFDAVKNPYVAPKLFTKQTVDSVSTKLGKMELKLNKYKDKKLSSLQKKEYKKLKADFKKVETRLKKVRQEEVVRNKAKKNLFVKTSLERIDELAKVSKLSKEQAKALVKLEKKVLNANKKIGKESTRLKEKVNKELQEYEDKLLQKKQDKLTLLQKKIVNLTNRSKTLKDIDKRSINDSFRYLEKSINDMRTTKDDLLDMVQRNKFSDLSGKYLPKEMMDIVNEVIDPTDPFGNKIIRQFKYMHVILSPATHMRNVMSNQTLNWWKLGIGPWRLDLHVKAASEIKNKGKYWKEWSSVGGGADTFAAQELKSMLEMSIPGAKTAQKNIASRSVEKAEKTLVELYQMEETYAKMMAFIEMRKKGNGIEEAFKMSESATFNYAQVTPFVRKLRSSIFGMPFITFSLKAAPIAVETMGKHTGRVSVFGKIKNNLFNAADVDETTQELESEPPWVRDGFFMKLPFKDAEGRSMYFDLTYVLPFGDLVSGSLFDAQTRRDTGVKEALPISIASVNPVFSILKELSRNETFSGSKIFKESDTQLEVGKDIMMYLVKKSAPPPLAAQIPDGYNQFSGERQDAGLLKASKDVSGTNKRNLSQELGAYLGFKVQPMDGGINEVYKEMNIKKGLETLLHENGVIKQYNRNYIPEEK